MHHSAKADWNQSRQRVKFANSNQPHPLVGLSWAEWPGWAQGQGINAIISPWHTASSSGYSHMSSGQWDTNHWLESKAARDSTWNTANFTGGWQALGEENRAAWCWYCSPQKPLSPCAAQYLLCHPLQSAGWFCFLCVFFIYASVCLLVFIFLPEGKCPYSV